MMFNNVKMSIYYIGILLLFSVNAEIVSNSRARRHCCGNVVSSSFTYSSSGGSNGCVVSGNKLYINGIFTKDLNADELQEVDQYKQNLEDYKNNSRKYFEQNWGNAPFGNEGDGEKNEKIVAPKPPKTPSFCDQKSRTQFIFNGCMVQGDSLYIGNNFVRKLNESEQKELEEFDEKLQEYNEAFNEQINRHFSETFGRSFGRFFGKKPFESNSEENDFNDNNSNASSTLPAERKQTQKTSKLEMPKPPEFCTVVA